MSGQKPDWNGTLSERFERYYIPEPNSGCWLWLGTIGRDQRAMIAVGRSVNTYAAHVSWRLYKKLPVPKGMLILHTCDMPACVNPDHLWLGSYSDNTNDAIKKGRYKYPTGEKHGKAKLIDANILEIRSGKLNDTSYAKKFGVSPQHVLAIKKRKFWKHLP